MHLFSILFILTAMKQKRNCYLLMSPLSSRHNYALESTHCLALHALQPCDSKLYNGQIKYSSLVVYNHNATSISAMPSSHFTSQHDSLKTTTLNAHIRMLPPAVRDQDSKANPRYPLLSQKPSSAMRRRARCTISASALAPAFVSRVPPEIAPDALMAFCLRSFEKHSRTTSTFSKSDTESTRISTQALATESPIDIACFPLPSLSTTNPSSLNEKWNGE